MMLIEDFIFPSNDGMTTIHGRFWMPDKSPIGAIQIVHGMTEYIGRYEEFASYFVSQGFLVYGHDIEGHGESTYKNLDAIHFDS